VELPDGMARRDASLGVLPVEILGADDGAVGFGGDVEEEDLDRFVGDVVDDSILLRKICYVLMCRFKFCSPLFFVEYERVCSNVNATSTVPAKIVAGVSIYQGIAAVVVVLLLLLLLLLNRDLLLLISISLS